jgi:hypothetical protein
MDLALPGPGYSQQPADRLPWVRVVVLIASALVSPDKDFGKRQSLFEAFLGQPPVASLVSSLASGGGTGLSWKRAVKSKAILRHTSVSLATSTDCIFLNLRPCPRYRLRSQTYRGIDHE